MDDVWGNAWGDPAEPSSSTTTLKLGKGWAAEDQEQNVEADVALPSWATGAGVGWNEPSENPTSLWTGNGSSSPPAWEADDNAFITRLNAQRTNSITPEIKSAVLRPATPQEDFRSETPRQPTPPPEPISEPEDEVEEKAPAPSSPPPHTPSPLTPPDPDHFGTFETGGSFAATDPNDQPWSPTADVFADQDEGTAWGSAWGAKDAAESEEEERPVDEWELAQEQKRRRDRKIPPGLLDSVVSSWSQYAAEQWPDPPPSETADWRDSFRDGLSSVESVAVIVRKVLPESQPPPPMPYRTTAVAKATTQALRYTKHVPIAQISPMSRLLAAKGSSAWELSVKSRKEEVPDDVPTGWRIVEPEATPQEAEKETKAGRFMSFWNRRASTVPSPKTPTSVEPAASTTQTPISRSSTPVPAALPSASPSSTRPSVDSASSSNPGRKDSGVPVDVASNSATPSLLPGLTELPKSDTFASVDIDANATASTPPSAVSRFLGRFSRPKTGPPTNRASLALSSDDLEFLSDVPSAADGDGGADDDDLKMLSAFVRPDHRLTTKLPPPLAPPPPPSTAPPPLSAFTSGVGNKHSSTLSEDLDGDLDTFLGIAKPTTSFTSRPSGSMPAPLVPSGLGAMPPILPSPPVSRPPSAMRSSPVSSHSMDDSWQRMSSPLAMMPSAQPQPSILPPSIRAMSPPLMPSPPPPAPIFAPPQQVTNRAGSQTTSPTAVGDDFSDFASGLATFTSPTASPSPSQLHTLTSSASFDDFDDFMSSPVSAPTPPPPIPSKLLPPNLTRYTLSSPTPPTARRTGSLHFPPAQMRASSSTVVNVNPNLNGTPKAIMSSSVLSAHPAPLPMALPPPPGFVAIGRTGAVAHDLLGDHAPTASLSTPSRPSSKMEDLFGLGEPLAATSPSLSPPPVATLSAPNRARIPTLSPPPLATPFSSGRIASPPMGAPIPKSHTPPIRPAPTPTQGGQKAGLSAQDLSFFEGL